jgi:hypothetical protein
MERFAHIGRRRMATLLIGFTLLALPLLFRGAPAVAHPRSQVSSHVCNVPWQRGKHQVKRLIHCAAHRWRVPGGPRKAMSVARCESGFRPHAYSGGNGGVFQQRVVYWRGRARRYGFRGWSVYNGRANVIVSIRMAHATGWGDWSCA